MIPVVIFEGIDGSGKTTLQEATMAHRRDLLYIYRYTASMFVYARLYHRHDMDLRGLIEADDRLKPAVVVWVKVDPSIAAKRRPDAVPGDLAIAQLFYEDWFVNFSRLPVIIVNTTTDPMEKSLSHILDRLASSPWL